MDLNSENIKTGDVPRKSNSGNFKDNERRYSDRKFGRDYGHGNSHPVYRNSQRFQSSGLRQPRQKFSHSQEPRDLITKKDEEKTLDTAEQSEEMMLSSLQNAVMHNRLGEVEELIRKGMSVNCQFSSGWTPLMYASNRANLEIVAYLLENGAEANSNKDDYTALMSACASTTSDEKRILSCVNLLLDHGADVNTQDRCNMTSLMYAAREGRTTVVKKLIEKNAAINRQDSKGNSALMWATQRGRVDVVETLIHASADVNLQKIDGTTALDIATANGHNQIIELLKDIVTQKPKSINEETPMTEGSKEIGSSLSRPTPTQSERESKNATQNDEHKLDERGVTVESNGISAVISPKNVSPSVPVNSAGTVPHKLAVDTPGVNVAHSMGTEVPACGDLELFLLGIDLRDLIPRFHSHEVTFQAFLEMTDTDLCQLGISSTSVRQRILNAIKNTHKKKSEPKSSTTSAQVSAPYSKKISCFEGLAMISNIKRHLGFVGSSVGYVSDRINEDRLIILESPDPIHVVELCSSTDEAIKSTEALYEELIRLRLLLPDTSPDQKFTPEDLASVRRVSRKRKNINWKRVLLLSGATATCIIGISWLLKS